MNSEDGKFVPGSYQSEGSFSRSAAIGWLIPALWATLRFWKRNISVWGDAALYTKRSSRKRRSHYRPLMDGVWLAVFASSVVVFWAYATWGGRSSPWLDCSLAGVALWRLVDLGFTGCAFCPFGPPDWSPRGRTRAELCRMLLLTLFNFCEVIVWAAVLYLHASWSWNWPYSTAKRLEPHEALLLSMTTSTTIGYGNIAPGGLGTTILATWQAGLSLLLLSVGVAGLVALIVSEVPENCRRVGQLPISPWRRRHGPAWANAGIVTIIILILVSLTPPRV